MAHPSILTASQDRETRNHAIHEHVNFSTDGKTNFCTITQFLLVPIDSTVHEHISLI